jgi:hypothetical protein
MEGEVGPSSAGGAAEGAGRAGSITGEARSGGWGLGGWLGNEQCGGRGEEAEGREWNVARV